MQQDKDRFLSKYIQLFMVKFNNKDCNNVGKYAPSLVRSTESVSCFTRFLLEILSLSFSWRSFAFLLANSAADKFDSSAATRLVSSALTPDLRSNSEVDSILLFDFFGAEGSSGLEFTLSLSRLREGGELSWVVSDFS
jgi:hypothetical protein